MRSFPHSSRRLQSSLMLSPQSNQLCLWAVPHQPLPVAVLRQPLHEAAVIPEDTTKAAVVLEDATESAIVPEDATEAALALEDVTEAVLVLEDTTEADIVPVDVTEALSGPEATKVNVMLVLMLV